MPIDKKTGNQFAADIERRMTERDPDWDATFGEQSDILVNPPAGVFETQHDDLRQVNKMQTLSDPTVFEGPFEVDLNNILYTETLTPSPGSRASTTLTFYRSAAPTTDLVVQRGYIIATLVDESSGQTVLFQATETRTMRAIAAASYFNIARRRYELQVPASAVVVGATGQVGARRLTRLVLPLAGFDGVTNLVAATGGLSPESISQKIDRYRISVLGSEPSTGPGIVKTIRDAYPEVADLRTAGGLLHPIPRQEDVPGAVDIYIQGSRSTTISESPAYVGPGQLLRIALAPLLEIASVQDLSTGTTFVEGTDYDVVFDESYYGRSASSVDGVVFRAAGAQPAIGVPVTITYSYDALIRQLQTDFMADVNDVFGRNPLFRRGRQVQIALGYIGTALVNPVDIKTAADAAVVALALREWTLGAPVQGSDIQGVVRAISGVGNYIITRLTRIDDASGTSDIDLELDEYATLDAADINGTFN